MKLWEWNMFIWETCLLITIAIALIAVSFSLQGKGIAAAIKIE